MNDVAKNANTVDDLYNNCVVP